jgi:hypothetical protein
VDGLVVAGGVDEQLAQQLAGGRVDDADVEVVDEQQDGGSGVGSADADVVEAAVDPQGDLAVGVDAVVLDQPAGGLKLPVDPDPRLRLTSEVRVVGVGHAP